MDSWADKSSSPDRCTDEIAVERPNDENRRRKSPSKRASQAIDNGNDGPDRNAQQVRQEKKKTCPPRNVRS
jgi:hypothetical protein